MAGLFRRAMRMLSGGGGARRADAKVVGRRGFHTLTPLSARAKRWMRSHVHAESWQKGRGGTVMFDDTRLASDIVAAMMAAGMHVEASAD